MKCALAGRVVNDSGDRRREHPCGNARVGECSAAGVHSDDGLIALLQLGGESIVDDTGIPRARGFFQQDPMSRGIPTVYGDHSIDQSLDAACAR